MICSVIVHYDNLIDEGHDPVHDSEALQEYMNQWDGPAFIEKMQLDKQKHVLEIGVGTGRLAMSVAPLCGMLWGVDISPKTIERAKKNLACFENAALICADFMTHTFTCYFDVIYSSLTFMHIAEKRKAIEKAAGLLNSKGRFVLSIDNHSDSYIDFVSRKVRIFPDSVDVTRENIEAAGLSVLEQYETEAATVFVAEKE